MEMTLCQHGPNDPKLVPILSLIRKSFAFMDGVVNPPSSMHRLTEDSMKTLAAQSEVWSIGPPLSACVILFLKPDAVYISKLSVAQTARKQGLARRLVEHAANRARAHKRAWLELETRVELTDNHAAFAAMGFHEVARTAHPGFTAPTALTYRRAVV